jgi:transposase-like protein
MTPMNSWHMRRSAWTTSANRTIQISTTDQLRFEAAWQRPRAMLDNPWRPTNLRDVILLAVRYYMQFGAAAERIAGLLADRGIDVSGRTILRWVQKFGPALSWEIRRHRKPVSTTWLVDETYVKIGGTWHYLYRGIDEHGQVLDCWLSRTRDLAAAEAFLRRSINSTGCTPQHVVTDKAAVYPSAIRTCAPAVPSCRSPQPFRLSRDSGEVGRRGSQCAPGGRAQAAATMRRFSRRVEARP